MKQDTIYSVIFGHAVADALGVPVEFLSRDQIARCPVTDMMGFGSYPYPAGSWSDDTSMSLCALSSLSNDKISWKDIMANFTLWLTEDKFTPTGECFDVGRTCLRAIRRWASNEAGATECGLTDEYSNGNGSLMRINPFVLYAFAKKMPVAIWTNIIHKASSLTHAHERSLIGCGIYAFVLMELLNNPVKESVNIGLVKAKAFYCEYKEFGHYERIFKDGFSSLDSSEINSSGYIVDTLEAALWCLLNSENYKDCVLKAVNLGRDTDTVGAVAGGLAGALYGVGNIPKKWLDTLQNRELIEDLCDKATEKWI